MGQLFGGGGGTSTTTSGLPAGFGWVAPGMSSLFRTLTGILSGGGSPYPYTMPNQTVAGFNPTQQSALGALGGFSQPGAYAGEGTSKNSMAFENDLVSGKYMDPNNKVLTDTINSMNQQTEAGYENATAPSTSSEFISAGSPGGSAYNNARNKDQYSLATELSNNANQIKGANYTHNLDLMSQAPGAIAQGEANIATPYQTALAAGNQKQQQAQNVANTNYQNQLGAAQWPYQAVSMIQNLLQGTTGFGGITKAMSGGGGLS